MSISLDLVNELRGGFAGQIVTPADGSYDDVRRVWNGMIDKRPGLIARCTGPADVISAVNFGRTHSLAIAVRGGGHNVAGFSTCDDGLVIDLSLMKGIWVDPLRHTVRAQGGVLWRDLDHELQAFALGTTGGLVSETGIAGLTLGGGIGWLMRKYGMTCDNLISADVVTAAGEFVVASESENSHLFWGLRGGGGNFGVVTSFEYRVHDVGPIVAGGAAFFPSEDAPAVLRFYRDFAAAAPDELTTMVAFLNAPPEPFIPAELQGKPVIAIAACYAGSVEDGMKTLQPVKDFGPPAVDLLGPIPYVVLQRMFDASAPRGIHSYWKTGYLTELSDAAIEPLCRAAAGMTSPFCQLHVHHLEGAVGRIAPEATAFGQRTMPFVMNVIGLWMPPMDAEPNLGWVRESWTSMKPFTGEGSYLNFMDADEGTRVPAAYGANYGRLASIKAKYDPANLFRLNQNIAPQA